MANPAGHPRVNPYHLPAHSATDPRIVYGSNSPQPFASSSLPQMWSPSNGSASPKGAEWAAAARAGGGGGAAANSKGKGVSSSGAAGKAKATVECDDDGDDDFGDDGDEASASGGGNGGEGAPEGEVKKKSTRGSRACTVCRKLKMRCVGAEEGPPCKRCKTAGHECIFEESQRGRRSNRKTDMMAKSLKKMEATLETVLKSISNPGLLASSGGLVSDPSLRQLAAPLDSGPGGSEGRGDIHVGSSSAAGPLPGIRQMHSGMLSALADADGRYEIGGSADGGRRGMEWSGVRSERGGASDDSPRLHSLPDNTLNPLGLLAEASLQNTRKRAVTLTEVLDTANGDVDSDERQQKRSKLGMGNPSYFQPGPMNILPLRRIVIEQRMPPALLEEKIVTVEEVVELFAIFFEHCHRQCPFLDADIHTPAATGSRSPFLFTCICTVAARYYTKRNDDLYRKCLRVAKRVAFDVMTKGFKSTEICQGFLLLCHWNQPAERFEEERTYQFSGIAIRMATDLNLHRKTLAVLPDEVSEETRTLYEREIMNRERTWMYSFICDRSVSTQMGKPYSIPKEDYIIRNAKTWYSQPGAQKSDSGLSAMVEMHRIVGRQIDTLYSDTRSVSGLNAHLDYPLLMRAFLGQLDQWRADWSLATGVPGYTPDHIRDKMREFYHSYYRLFLLSFAVQHALDNPDSNIDLASYCVLCFESASKMIGIARDFLGPNGILRYAMDSTFVYLSYAATFLLKLISPTFTHIIDEETAMRLVLDVADTFERSAVDDAHTPALYASFLRALIENKLNGHRTVPSSRMGTRPPSPALGGATGMDSFLKSRANSVGPLEGITGGGGGEMGEGETTDQAFDSMAMDSMLANGGFWDNMLMPGFGGPLTALSGGTGTMLGNMADPWSVTPMHSRPGSPNSFAHHFPTFDFAVPPGSS